MLRWSKNSIFRTEEESKGQKKIELMVKTNGYSSLGDKLKEAHLLELKARRGREEWQLQYVLLFI